MDASVVLGLGFGDEGKGVTTDFLCSQSRDPLVIRFSGGQQAGHTVMIDGKKHIHSSYGAGTLRGIPSYFSEHTTIYPNSIEAERKVLEKKGVTPRLIVHPFANLTTPYDVAWNRLRETFVNHGSCGLGISATMARNTVSPAKVFAMDFMYPQVLEQKMKAIKKFYYDRVATDDIAMYEELVAEQADVFIELIGQPIYEMADYGILKNHEHLIFEGSQGILLDMDHGFFPNVTWANTTSKNAFEILKKVGHYAPVVYYVTRCYQTRHGVGWMSNEEPVSLENNEEEINKHNAWQKDFRIGELDYDLLNYSMEVDNTYSGSCRKNLVVTCLDQRPGFSFDPGNLKLREEIRNIYGSYSPQTGLQELERRVAF